MELLSRDHTICGGLCSPCSGSVSRRRFASQAEAKMACFSYIEGWYNPVRLHSGLGYRSPITYEADMQAAMTKT